MKILFAIFVFLFCLSARAEKTNVDMRDVWTAKQLAGKPICAPSTDADAVPCVAAYKDYSFTSTECGFISFLGRMIANCVVRDDFGTWTWGFATNNGAGYRMQFPFIRNDLTDADIKAAGSTSGLGFANFQRMTDVFKWLFSPKCPVMTPHESYLVERFQYDMASNVVSVDAAGNLSLSMWPWPHANCPQ